MKITFTKDFRQYHINYGGMKSAAWLCTQDGEGMGLNEANLNELQEAIFDAIDGFFNKHM